MTGNRTGLAPAASSPGHATTAAATAAAAASAAAATSASPAASAAAAGASYLDAIARSSAIFLVEDIERREADVGHFLLAESGLLARCKIRRLRLILGG